MAQAGNRILLLDADFRKPMQHRIFEIDAKVEAGTPENVVRIVPENSRTLKFTSHGFEEE